MVLIGKWAQRKVKTPRILSGAHFGKVLTTFMNFGNITSADQATGVTRDLSAAYPGYGFKTWCC